ncbi:Phosphoserine transaminase [Dimargaris cristalligena]|uniref:Phosphoserine aminotransferase n=1 Tax=Dimargaris cristalligena TaxID=215637 RepID=A0A4P9ZJG1_9FUNG|nr:Phosphoserine transaminase [Dimargaris cristalligena]RKP33168.1 phosphoserine aminotransferase [Dimargaris cristalligena]|eukprot:RKP33168.1 phosphoserine aminotransferase [Dimargaris cristalligena]
MSQSVHNFGAGPSVLPASVLARAQHEFLNFADTGMSILEVSHRSAPFDRTIRQAEANARALLAIPDNYSILFLQGGATTQFAAVWYNLMAARVIRERFPPGASPIPVDYLVTGTWSKKAAQEAAHLGASVNIVFDAAKSAATHHTYTGIPPRSEWQFSGPDGRDAAYVYYCDNETVHGVEWDHVPTVHPDTILVCDMSSNIMSRPVDVSKFGIVYAGAQKNMGPAGVTFVVIRNDLLAHADPSTFTPFPIMLDYQVAQANNSLYNTPPTFAIYMCGLVYDWIQEQGGVAGMAEQSRAKCALLNTALARSRLYLCPVAEPYRSRMNVVINLTQPDLEETFLKGAQALGMLQLKGHRSVGGIRVSLYNALPLESVRTLVDYMTEFEAEHLGSQ